MKTTGLVKRLLISSAVLSGLFLVGTSQASANTTDEGATATNSTATTTASNKLTGSTTLKSATLAPSTDAVVDEATSSESTTTPATDTDTTTPTDDTTVPVADATSDPAVTADSPSSIDTTATPAPTAPTTDTTTAEPQSSTTTEASSSAVNEQAQSTTATPVVSYKTARDAVVSASVVTADLQLTPEAETIQSGEAATFDLKLAISGIDKTTNPQHVVVDLPDNFQLADGTDLTIDGVTPTLNETGTQLIYDFATPTAGLSISKKYVFDTANQPITNGTTISMAASYFDDTTQLATSGEQTVTVTTEANYGVATKFVGVLAKNDDGTVAADADGNVNIDTTKLTGVAGDYLAYQIGISAPKKILGQAYFQPDSIITLNYQLPKGLTFWNAINYSDSDAAYSVGTNPDTGESVITFEIKAPSIADQLAADDNLFSGYFIVGAQIDSDVAPMTSLTTAAQLAATTLEGQQVMSAVATSKLTTTVSLPSFNNLRDGSVYAQYNWGPADGNGYNISIDRLDPQVGPDADLAFLMQTGPDLFWGIGLPNATGTPDITKYIATYNVDAHLDVNQMKIYGLGAYYGGNVYNLTQSPTLNLYVRYQDETNFEQTPVLANVSLDQDMSWDMNQIIDNTRGVAQLKFDYSNIPARLVTNVRFNMSPKAGYYGQVSNDFTVEIAGNTDLKPFGPTWLDVLFSKDGAFVQGYSDGTPSDRDGQDIHMLDLDGLVAPEGSEFDVRDAYNQYMTPQTAEIVKPAENTPRVLNETLTFADQSNGKITAGDNTIQVMVENNKASLQSFSDLKSVLVLPAGVTYTGDDAGITATPQADGSTQLTINWTRTSLSPNEQNKLNVAVNIDASLNLDSITPTLYSTVAETDTVAPGTIDPATDSDVQKVADDTDIDQTATTANAFKLQQTLAMATNAHQIHVAATATSGNDTGELVKVQAGKDASFGLSLTPASDGALQNVTIIGTLPTLNDTAVLNPDTARGTTASVKLSGAITLPDDWQAATVTYALADDPTTYVAATDVSDFGQVVGFKITYDGDGYLSSDAQQLAIPVKVDAKATTGQVAYISYSVSANGLKTTEGLKAGLQIETAATTPGNPTGPTTDPTGPTTDPTGPTTPVTTPTTTPTTPTAPDNPSTEPSTPANSIGTPTDNNATDNDTTVNDSNSSQATNDDTPSATTTSQTSNATATMATTNASQVTANDAATATTSNNASATLPQTDEQAPATTSLIGLLLAAILGGLGLSRKRRNE